MRPQKHVIVIGAGPGGLTAAMILAHRGLKVTVLEKGAAPGGRNGELAFDGYSFDIGPTFLHQRFTLDEVFAEAGRKSGELLDFRLLDPMTQLTWADASMSTTSDAGRMAAEVERVFPGSESGFRRYMTEQGAKFRGIFPCLKRPFHSPWALLHPNVLRALPWLCTRKSLFDSLGRYFQDDRLKLAFTFQSKYLGMSPWNCPALFSILSFIEYRFGVWHVQGGLNRISHAMAKVLEESGGELRLHSPVKEVLHSGRHAHGVELESGERLHADAVVVNADYGCAASRLFGAANVPEETLRKKKFSCSTLMLYLGLDKLYADEPHHHILFADDYRRNVREITGERQVSADMSVYVRNSGVTDPGVAPAGKSGLYILVPAINMRHGYAWQDHAGEYANCVLTRIEQRTGMKDLRRHIVTQRVITPQDWERDCPLFMGATFNLAHTLGQMLCFRPHNRYGRFHNCYLTGGGTHPGSGLPTIYESGRICANLICDSFKVPFEGVDYASDFLRSA